MLYDKVNVIRLRVSAPLDSPHLPIRSVSLKEEPVLRDGDDAAYLHSGQLLHHADDGEMDLWEQRCPLLYKGLGSSEIMQLDNMLVTREHPLSDQLGKKLNDVSVGRIGLGGVVEGRLPEMQNDGSAVEVCSDSPEYGLQHRLLCLFFICRSALATTIASTTVELLLPVTNNNNKKKK